MTLLMALIRKEKTGAACSSIFSLYASARVARGARARCFAGKNVAKTLKKLGVDAWECVGTQKRETGASNAKKMRSDTGTRTRVSSVRGSYANRLHHIGNFRLLMRVPGSRQVMNPGLPIWSV